MIADRAQELHGLVPEAVIAALCRFEGHVLGVDADCLRLAWSLVTEREVRTGLITRRKPRGDVAPDYDRQLRRLMGRCADLQAEVALEGVYLASGNGSAGRYVRAFAGLCEVQGEIKSVARVYRVRLVVVPPTTWHTTVLGFVRNRAALKRAAMEVARRVTASELTQDEADATCVAVYAAVRSVWQRGAGSCA